MNAVVDSVDVPQVRRDHYRNVVLVRECAERYVLEGVEFGAKRVAAFFADAILDTQSVDEEAVLLAKERVIHGRNNLSLVKKKHVCRSSMLALPDDVLEHIRRHASAMSIQRALRLHQYRFVRRSEWRELVTLLVRHAESDALPRLFRSEHVRHEWRTEPDSWIYMLTYEPDVLRDIVDELT